MLWHRRRLPHTHIRTPPPPPPPPPRQHTHTRTHTSSMRVMCVDSLKLPSSSRFRRTVALLLHRWTCALTAAPLASPPRSAIVVRAKVKACGCVCVSEASGLLARRDGGHTAGRSSRSKVSCLFYTVLDRDTLPRRSARHSRDVCWRAGVCDFRSGHANKVVCCWREGVYRDYGTEAAMRPCKGCVRRFDR